MLLKAKFMMIIIFSYRFLFLFSCEFLLNINHFFKSDDDDDAIMGASCNRTCTLVLIDFFKQVLILILRFCS